VYFMKHLDDAGLLSRNAEILRQVQDRVVELKCLQPYTGSGIDGTTPLNSTFCNHATFLTIQAVDKNYKQFIGNPSLFLVDRPPWWDLIYLAEGPFKERHRAYRYRTSNLWCDILNEQAAHSEATGICKIEPEDAQAKANQGYVVIAAWKNTSGLNEPPHYATVRPGSQYDSENGPMIANVGGTNYKEVRAQKGFWVDDLSEIKYYYNRNQDFTIFLDKIVFLENRG
jgi:hypothetical protein